MSCIGKLWEDLSKAILLNIYVTVLLPKGNLNLANHLPSSHISIAMASGMGIFKPWEKEESVLFHDALNTFYLHLYGIGHMIKDHTGNPLPPLHKLQFPISSKRSFICTIPQTG